MLGVLPFVAFGSLLLRQAFGEKAESKLLNAGAAVTAFRHPDTQSLSLKDAEDKFQQRGGKYIFGPNDCSIFLTDYLKSRGVRFNRSGIEITNRLTTENLYETSFMKGNGFEPVSADKVKENDILVYRYYDIDLKAECGHCGIVVWKNSTLSVEHNSSGNKGLATTPMNIFLERVALEKRTKDDSHPPEIKYFRWTGLPVNP